MVQENLPEPTIEELKAEIEKLKQTSAEVVVICQELQRQRNAIGAVLRAVVAHHPMVGAFVNIRMTEEMEKLKQQSKKEDSEKPDRPKLELL